MKRVAQTDKNKPHRILWYKNGKDNSTGKLNDKENLVKYQKTLLHCCSFFYDENYEAHHVLEIRFLFVGRFFSSNLFCLL